MPYYIKRKKAKKKDKPLPLFDKAGITIKKKPDLKAKLDKEFSLFIRLRDCMPNGFFRCTRFDENNCHAECRHCNRFKADHLEGYRVNLIDKIGQQKFALLKVKAVGTTKMTDFEYEQLIKYYKTLNKKLRKEKGV